MVIEGDQLDDGSLTVRRIAMRQEGFGPALTSEVPSEIRLPMRLWDYSRGKIAEYLKGHGIEASRTPLSSSMGKMSGYLLGVGMVLTIGWSLLQ